MKRVKQIMLLIIGVIMVMSLSLTGMASDYVCYIGTTGYGSLAEAVMYAQDGDTIWMTANDEVSDDFTVDKSITIELEGYSLPNACIKFSGNIAVKLNDRVGTSVLNENKNIGYTIGDDFSTDPRPRASFYLTKGANVTVSGATGGTKFYGGNEIGTLPKAFVVGQGCRLTVNGGTMLYSGESGSDGIFVCDTGILTLNDIMINRYTSYTGGSSLSYANVPTLENPLTIKKGLFYGGMWIEGRTTINGVSIGGGRLDFKQIEDALLYTSAGSYIDYDKSTHSDGWEIWVASENLSTDTNIDNTVDATETLRVSAGGDITAYVGQKVLFQPQVTGGDGKTEITYSWEFNGETISDPSSAHLIDGAVLADAGTYVFTATQGEASVSCTFVLSVIEINSEWSYDTDGGYYLGVSGDKIGVIRFLFDVEINGVIEESGIKFINADNLVDSMEEQKFIDESVKGTARTFYGDITEITEDKSDNNYYAAAYVVVNNRTYWSQPQFVAPNFDKFIEY